MNKLRMQRRVRICKMNIIQLRPYRASGERLTVKESIANYNIMV